MLSEDEIIWVFKWSIILLHVNQIIKNLIELKKFGYFFTDNLKLAYQDDGLNVTDFEIPKSKFLIWLFDFFSEKKIIVGLIFSFISITMTINATRENSYIAFLLFVVEL